MGSVPRGEKKVTGHCGRGLLGQLKVLLLMILPLEIQWGSDTSHASISQTPECQRGVCLWGRDCREVPLGRECFFPRLSGPLGHEAQPLRKASISWLEAASVQSLKHLLYRRKLPGFLRHTWWLMGLAHDTCIHLELWSWWQKSLLQDSFTLLLGVPLASALIKDCIGQ